MLESGIDRDELDEKVRPQDDLFRHVNGKWIARTEIPADKARYGSFMQLAEQAEKAVHEIVLASEEEQGTESAEGHKIFQLYKSFMEVGRLNELGASPLAKDFAQVEAVTTRTELFELMGSLSRRGIDGPVGLFVDNDLSDPHRYIVFLVQSGLGMPDRSYYLDREFEPVREKYRSHIVRMLKLMSSPLGIPASTSEEEYLELFDRIYNIEHAFAKKHWSKTDSRDILKTYNLRSFAELRELTPLFEWDAFLCGLRVDESKLAHLVIAQPSAFEGISKLFDRLPLEDWKMWLKWCIIRSSAGFLSQEISSASFDFYGTVLSGIPKQRDRWRRAVGFVEGAMGEAVGKRYVAAHFDEQAKNIMDDLVGHLLQAYRESIMNLEWMGEETKKRALEKLETFCPKIGYPKKWKDYSALEVGEDLLENARAVSEFVLDREIGKLGREIDRDEWFMTPQTVNAYYNPGLNEIVFPAAILQPPFFDQNADMAVNFGAIGAVIGHEIGHGFDDQGSQYDGEGKLNNWWTKEDRDAFDERTHALIAQYNALSPEGADGKTVNGELTIGENIGDLGGLAIAWKAYERFGGNREVIDGFTAAERFFYGWAQAWRSKSRPEETVRLLTIDPHSPAEFRCNQIVRNLDVFHEVFGTTPGDALWLAPEDRVSIW